MPNWTASVAAASAGIGIDILSGEVWARSPRNRVLNGVSLTGSAAAGDTEVDLYIDTVLISNFFNNALGFGNIDDLLPQNAVVPAGAQLRMLVTDAPTTNPINAILGLEDV